KDTDSLLSGARVEIDGRKRSPLDFALWKKSKEGEPVWESPWGNGRPGWHVECSAMSQKYLGETFDIHGGGMDLIFPHHENEIAQAECTTGKSFARYWIHNGFVNINHEKMSKSLKNFLTIREVLTSYHPEAIRLFLLSHHYRSPVDYSDQNLAEAKTGLDRFYALLNDLRIVQKAAKPEDALDPAERKAGEEAQAFPEKFKGAMDDDFNTAAALGHLYSFTRTLNSLVDRSKKDAAFKLQEALVQQAQSIFENAGSVLGLFSESPAAYFQAQKETAIGSRGIAKEEIERLIAERLRARKEKNWSRADEIRTCLLEKGIVLKDSPQGTDWSFSDN
ncbi:MAG: cysteine--tRNA ligase, partial [Pseudomonadota bacterium]